MFMTVGIPNSRRTGPTCRMAGCMAGANMKVIPASSSARAATSTGASSVTPSCSRTSALPHCVVNERLPCLAIRTPAPEASSAAAVEMLKVGTAPPPVPQVSTRSSAEATGRRTIAPRSARAAPVTSSAVSPFTRRPISSAAICEAVASPRMMISKALVASSASSESPKATRRIAAWSAVGVDAGAVTPVTPNARRWTRRAASRATRSWRRAR